MKNETIGHMICETASSEPREAKILTMNSKNRAVIEAILQDADVKNRNGRFYAMDELFPALQHKRIQELLTTRNLFGEAGHPISNDLARMQTICNTNMSHLITKLWTDRNYVKAIVEASPTRTGEDFHNCVMADCKMAFSLRALGSVKNTSRGAEVQNLKIITWDWVIYPSHQSAYQTNVITSATESAALTESCIDMRVNDKGIFRSINNDEVINYIKGNSKNLKSVLETFEVFYKSIELLPNKRQVKIVSESGESYIINLENHIKNNVMDWCCSISKRR